MSTIKLGSAPKNKVKCTVTGLWFGMTTNVRKQRIERAGSEAAFRDNYICREARSLLKVGKSEDEIREMVHKGTLHSEATAPKIKKAAAKKKNIKPEAKSVVEEIKNEDVADKDIVNFLSLT